LDDLLAGKMAVDYDEEISEIIHFIHGMAESELDPRKHRDAFNILENLLLELRSIALKAGRPGLVESADRALAGLSKTLDEGCPFTDWLR
jgi:hypothetical protein